MYTSNLCKVGDSVMLVIPPTLLEQLHLKTGATVTMTITAGILVIEPVPQPYYTLAELLATSDYSQSQPLEERKWIDAPAVGGELI